MLHVAMVFSGFPRSIESIEFLNWFSRPWMCKILFHD